MLHCPAEMTTEAYIPTAVTFDGRALDDTLAATLYDPDGDDPHGALTTHHPLATGTRGGQLVIVGTRDKKSWRVTLPEIEVYRTTAVGFEFLIVGRIARESAS